MSAFKVVDGIDQRLGREIGRAEGPYSDEYTVSLRIFPHEDLKITHNIDLDFFVSPGLRDFGGVRVFIRDEDTLEYIPPEYRGEEGGKTTITFPWMVKIRYSVPVWFFAVRRLFRVDGLEPWRSSVLVAKEFRSFDEMVQGGISSGRHLASSSSKSNSGATITLFFGTANSQGRRPYMEDVDLLMETFPIDTRDISVFGVLDGHGGQDCARFVAEDFPSILAKLIRGGNSCPESLFRAFQEVDQSYIKHTRDSHAGSTANLAVFDKGTSRLYIANTGDTRAVLSRDGVAMELSYDRKASDAEEIARIVRAGGFVVNNRVLGTLAVSRAFGDIPLKSNPNVLLVDPEITCVNLAKTNTTSHANNFVIIATDGLWDVYSSQEAVDFVRTRLVDMDILDDIAPYRCKLSDASVSWAKEELRRKLQTIADALVKSAIQERNSMDNVTVLLALVQAQDPGRMDGDDFDDALNMIPAFESSSSNKKFPSPDERNTLVDSNRDYGSSSSSSGVAGGGSSSGGGFSSGSSGNSSSMYGARGRLVRGSSGEEPGDFISKYGVSSSSSMASTSTSAAAAAAPTTAVAKAATAPSSNSKGNDDLNFLDFDFLENDNNFR